jgi:hypothetical protein
MTASTPEPPAGTLLDALRTHALKGSPAVQSLRAKLGDTDRDEQRDRRTLLATAEGVHAVFKSLRTVRPPPPPPNARAYLPPLTPARRLGSRLLTTPAPTSPPQELQGRGRGDSVLLASLLQALKEGYKYAPRVFPPNPRSNAAYFIRDSSHFDRVRVS